MRAPGKTDRALARRGGAKLFGCLTALAIYGAANGLVPWPVALLLGVLTIAAGKARAEVVSYDRWTGNWNSLLKPKPARTALRRRSRLRELGRVVAFALFVYAGLLLVARGQASGLPFGACLAGVCGLAIAGRFALRFVPGLRLLVGEGRARRAREFTVAICPARPLRAPKPNIAGLPPYCRALLSHQAGAPPRRPAPSHFAH